MFLIPLPANLFYAINIKGQHMSVPACLLNSQEFTFDVGANTRDMHTCPESIVRPNSDVADIIPDTGLPEPVKEARHVRFAEENQVKRFREDDPITIPEIVVHQQYQVRTHKEGVVRLPDQTNTCTRPAYYLEILIALCVIAAVLFFYECPSYSIIAVMIALIFIATYAGCHGNMRKACHSKMRA